MTFRIGWLLASLASAAVFAGSAAAIPPPEEAVSDGPESAYLEDVTAPDSELEYELAPEYDIDVVESDPGIVCGGGGSEPIATALATSGPSTLLTSSETPVATETGGDACASGAYRPACSKVTVTVTKKTWLHLSVAFTWVVEKEWCWDYPRVTWHRVRTYTTAIDRFMHYRGMVSQWDTHFTWCCFSSRSGHRTYRMAQYENCVPLRGCLGSWFPRVLLETYGNGRHRVVDKNV